MKKASVRIAAVFMAMLLLFAFPFSAAGTREISGPSAQTRQEIEKISGAEPYSEVFLSTETKEELAGIDGDVELLIVSSEHDFMSGELFHHYYDLNCSDKSIFENSVNILKTIAEYNGYIRLSFLDPNSVYSNSALNKYSAYNLKYGDLLISCNVNFDGNPEIRRKLIKANQLFEVETDKSFQKQIVGTRVETSIKDALSSLRETRDINVAVIRDICSEEDILQLKTYVWDRYNFKTISFSDERFFGYDMLIIASPFRDITLEEANILSAFLDNDGKQGKSIAFFSPKEYVKLNNMYSFLNEWGISMEGGFRLSASVEQEYIVDSTQIYAESTNSDYSKITDSRKGIYIMDQCTPMKLESNKKDIKITTLLDSKTSQLQIVEANIDAQITEPNMAVSKQYPLLAVSERTNKGKSSYIIAAASSDILTSHFSRQNYKSTLKPNFVGKLCSNLDIVSEAFDKINAEKTNDDSGLKAYVIGLNERGYEITSGLDRRLIMGIAFGGVAFVILLMLAIIFIADRRKKDGK